MIGVPQFRDRRRLPQGPALDFPAAQAARFTQGRGLKRGSLYRGAVGQWVWVAHRISGVAIFLFLFVHILDTAVIRISPAAYNQIIGMYHAPIMALGELVLVAAVTFHALNGVRIILIDYWSRGAEFQQHMLYILIGVFVILMSVFAFIHLGNTLFHQGALL